MGLRFPLYPSEHRTQIRNVKCEMALTWRKGTFKAWDVTSAMLHNHFLAGVAYNLDFHLESYTFHGWNFASWWACLHLILENVDTCKCWVLGSSPSPLSTAFPKLAFGFGSNSQGEFRNLNQKKTSIVVVVVVCVLCVWALEHISTFIVGDKTPGREKLCHWGASPVLEV